jgi:hypothetical protein
MVGYYRSVSWSSTNSNNACRFLSADMSNSSIDSPKTAVTVPLLIIANIVVSYNVFYTLLRG